MKRFIFPIIFCFFLSAFMGCVGGMDTDGDGEPDLTDQCPLDPNKLTPGECGCGIAEGSCSDTDTDGDGTPDQTDGCPSDPNKTDPGQCGCGVAEGTCSDPGNLDNGLKGVYYNGANFDHKAYEQTASVIDYDWGESSPAPGVDPDVFSIRWTGSVEPVNSETYSFTTTSDDGVRLLVNNKLIINDWTAHSALDDTGMISLKAGERVNIKLEYFDTAGRALIKLYWSSASQPKEIIPTSHLFTDYDESGTTDPEAFARITSPTEGAVFQTGDQITIKTDTYSPDSIGIVRFWVNDGSNADVVCEVLQPPFECNWKPTATGTYQLNLRAKDGSGEMIISDPITINVKGGTSVECPKGAATSDNRSHDCTYNPGGSPKGNLRMKYPGGKWISVGCKNGKPVADNSNTQWKMEGRQLHVVGSSLKLDCPELDHPCTCGSSAENFHGMSPDYKSANALGNAINYPGGGWIFNNNGHETCLGIHKQGRPGEIESIWSRPKGPHNHDWPGHSHKECPIFCLGNACP